MLFAFKQIQYVSRASQYVNKSFVSGAPSVALESVIYVLAIYITDVYQFFKRSPPQPICFMPYTAY